MGTWWQKQVLKHRRTLLLCSFVIGLVLAKPSMADSSALAVSATLLVGIFTAQLTAVAITLVLVGFRRVRVALSSKDELVLNQIQADVLISLLAAFAATLSLVLHESIGARWGARVVFSALLVGMYTAVHLATVMFFLFRAALAEQQNEAIAAATQRRHR